jgi:hypothetical protein
MEQRGNFQKFARALRRPSARFMMQKLYESRARDFYAAIIKSILRRRHSKRRYIDSQVDAAQNVNIDLVQSAS